MSKEIKYGYYVEDIAQAIFLENLLPQLIKQYQFDNKFSFQKDNHYFTDYGTISDSGRNDFDLYYTRYCYFALEDYKLDVFFLGRDADSQKEKVYKEMLGKIESSLDEYWREKIIIFLPVQCTEYWLRYIKELKKGMTVDSIGEFEIQRRKRIKSNIYGNKKWDERQAYIQELCSDIDISSLCQLSESFNHFVESIQSFLHKLEQE